MTHAFALFVQLVVTIAAILIGINLTKFWDELSHYAATTRQTRWAAFKDIWCYTFRRWIR